MWWSLVEQEDQQGAKKFPDQDIRFVKSVKLMTTSCRQKFRVVILSHLFQVQKQMPLHGLQILLETFHLCYFELSSSFSIPWHLFTLVLAWPFLYLSYHL